MTSENPKARFFDGRSARPQPAQVAVEGQSLKVTLAAAAEGERETVLLWPAGNVKLVDAADHGPSDTFTNLMLPMSRLVMASPDDARVLAQALNITHQDSARFALNTRAMALWASFAVVGVVFILFGIPFLSAKIAPHMPYEWRYEFGRYVVRALAGNQDRCIGDGRRALFEMTDRLTAAAGHREKVHVEVTKSKVVNAFAAPGGSIVIFEGLLDAVESPEELAGVLGHELGHVIKEHPTVATMRAFGFSLALTVIFGSSDAGMASTAIMIHSLSYNRRAEREADEIGADLLTKINVDPVAMTTFFERMQKREGGHDADGMFTYLSTHPAWPERIAAIKSHAAPAAPAPLLDADAWRALKEICGKKVEKKDP